MPTRPLQTLVGLAASVALVSGGVVLSTTAAQAVPVSECPEVFPAANLVEGQPVTGLTTTKGTTPEQFTGEYVDTLDNGIGKGKDLLVFKMAGSRITFHDGKAHDGDVDAGIWAGMSGSPVYTESGELIGAVSYGFSRESSDYAGVTPAQYMYDLRTAPSSSKTARTSPETVNLPTKVKSSLVKDGVPAAATNDGLQRLVPARFVGGATSTQARTFAKRAGFDGAGYRAGTGTASATADFPITAGGNFATSWSYGDITLAGVGTATAVSGDEVLAYGHPEDFSGESTETIHGASATHIQPDGTGSGSYKLANVGAPVGSLVQDRLAGILGKLGTIAPVTTIETTTTAYGKTSSGMTKVSNPDALSFVTAIQAASDTVYALDQDKGGDALVSWSIDFTREGGETETFSRTQHYSVASELSYEVPNDVASDVDALVNNGFERLTISNVHITSNLSPDYQGYKVGKVEFLSKGAWHRVGNGASIRSKPGATVKLRLTYNASDVKSKATPVTSETVSWKISKSARKSGEIKLDGNAFLYDDEDLYAEELNVFVAKYRPESLEELLDIMGTPERQDNLSARLSVKTKRATKRTYRTLLAPGVVSGSYVVRLKLK